MTFVKGMRLVGLGLLPILVIFPLLVAVSASEDRADEARRKNLREPVFRVSNRSSVTEKDRNAPPPTAPVVDQHPLDPALKMASDALVKIRRDIKDYTCTLVKQERVNGVVLDPEYMFTNHQAYSFIGSTLFTTQQERPPPVSFHLRRLLPWGNMLETNGTQVLDHEGSGVNA